MTAIGYVQKAKDACGISLLAGALWLAAGCGDATPEMSEVAQENETRSGAADSPAGRSRADAKSADAMPADAEPADAKPADAKPADAEPADAKPADAKPADAEPSSERAGAEKDPKAERGGPMAAADDCDARVVSRMKPCSKAPDPCGLNSGFDGDEYCLLPPPANKGIQLHFGPKNYDDPAETGRYTVEPGAALNESLLAHSPLDSDRFMGRVTVHMRPGVLQWISMAGATDAEEGVYSDMGCGGGRQFGSGGFGGGQNLIYDNPPQGVAAPENEAIGRKVAGNASCMTLYSYNRTDKPQLREAWVNLYFAEEPKDPPEVSGVGMVGGLGLALPPGEKTVVNVSQTFTGEGRILQLFGHRRQWTTRFAVWLNDRLIYDSRQWEEAVVYNFDSITTNPPIDPDGLKDGAVSGVVRFEDGDTLKASCFVDNTSDRTLTFTSEPKYAEMCNLWGSFIGGSLR